MAVQIKANLPELFAAIAPFIIDSKIFKKMMSGHRSSSSKPLDNKCLKLCLGNSYDSLQFDSDVTITKYINILYTMISRHRYLIC